MVLCMSYVWEMLAGNEGAGWYIYTENLSVIKEKRSMELRL